MFTFADDLSRLQKSIIFVQKKKPKHGVQIDMTSTDTETLWKLAEISKNAMSQGKYQAKKKDLQRHYKMQSTLLDGAYTSLKRAQDSLCKAPAQKTKDIERARDSKTEEDDDSDDTESDAETLLPKKAKI